MSSASSEEETWTLDMADSSLPPNSLTPKDLHTWQLWAWSEKSDRARAPSCWSSGSQDAIRGHSGLDFGRLKLL